jgi:hypothetical protein
LIKQFNRDIDHTKQIIRRFDEVLLEKANKFDIEKINKQFKTFLENSLFETFKIAVSLLPFDVINILYSKQEYPLNFVK